MKYILALDQGTTSSRAIVFDKQGRVCGKAQQEFKQIYPKPGWVEHDPHDIYGSQVGVISEALIRAGVSVDSIAAIGITNQRETTFVWERATGRPVYNAIVWQCRRTADYCEELKRDGLADMIYQKTGLVLDAYFSATKLKWILDNVPAARGRAEKGELLFGTVDTYLMWQLSKGKIFATDYTNASRTMLFNIHTLKWDDDLLQLFDIPRGMLPEVYPSGHNFGLTDDAFIGREIPICSVVGDQQAALFGHLAVNSGDVKNTYGTGCFLLMNTGDKAVLSTNGLVTTLAAGITDKPQYVLEGSVFIGGAINQWLRDEMRMIKSAKETENYAVRVPSTDGVYVVPGFAGLGAPYWDADARGTIVGITRGTQKEHFIRACLESIDYQVYDLVAAMQRDADVKITNLNVDGGASANNFLMQFQADILDANVVRPMVTETTALGASYLAGLTIGYWKDIDDIRSNVEVDKVFVPHMNEHTRRDLIEGWQKAVRQTLCK
ncbi:MAG TPA: glycerol kinase [Clostridiales bacterium]|nr:glycerol kinase [Clostridiales bacterium]